MRKALFTLLLFVAAATAGAQEIVKGDMNNDDQLTVADVTSLVDVVIGRSPKQTISLGVDPYKVDNTLVIGTWYAPDGTFFTLNEDGTTTYSGAATYKFRPNLGSLLFFNTNGVPVKKLTVEEVEPASYLLATDYSKNAFTCYTGEASLATGINLDQTSLSMNSGTTAQLKATVSPEEAIATITWTSSDERVATVDQNGLVTAVAGGTCTITAKTSGSNKTATCSVTVKQMATSIVLSQTTAVLQLDELVRLTATVLPENAANKNVTWSSSNEDVAFLRNGCVVAYGYGIATITCEAADGSGVKATCTVSVLDPSTYVDLGLPSGTLWATCNIGATSPEDYGDYFAWGETAGYNDGKTNFNWSTYKWCEGSMSTMTKYCTDSSYGYNGFTDNKTELDLEDDAAYVNWGPAWRIPSNEQFIELINSQYTTTTWTTQNGVNGCLITSKSNSNSIFLPAAGIRSDSSLYSAGSYGYYWSRTLNESYLPGNARGLGFGSGDIGTDGDGGYRCDGFSVRPVRLSE